MAVRDRGPFDDADPRDAWEARDPQDPRNAGRRDPAGVPDSSSPRDDSFPAFTDLDPAGGIPQELSLEACPFCCRMVRPDADVCHRCGNFLLHDLPHRAGYVRWAVAMAMFGVSVYFLIHAGLLR